MPKMIATDKHPKAQPGAEINVASGLVRFHKIKGWATSADELRKKQEDENLDALRVDYERLTGEKARGNWKAETLRTKVEDARRTYQRRDMRSEG